MAPIFDWVEKIAMFQYVLVSKQYFHFDVAAIFSFVVRDMRDNVYPLKL